MTPIDVSPEGVAFATLPRVPEAARALVAATGAAEVTFRTRLPLGELLDDLADAMAGGRMFVGAWSVDAEVLLRHLIRAAAADEGADLPVGVAFAAAGPEAVLVLVGASDAWRVGLVAEVAQSTRPGDLLVAIEPVAPPGVDLGAPQPARARPALRLVRCGPHEGPEGVGG